MVVFLSSILHQRSLPSLEIKVYEQHSSPVGNFLLICFDVFSSSCCPCCDRGKTESTSLGLRIKFDTIRQNLDINVSDLGYNRVNVII